MTEMSAIHTKGKRKHNFCLLNIITHLTASKTEAGAGAIISVRFLYFAFNTGLSSNPLFTHQEFK